MTPAGRFDVVSRVILALAAAALLWILGTNLHVARLELAGSALREYAVKPKGRRLQERVSDFRRAARDSPDTEPTLLLGSLYYIAGRRQDAIARYLEVLRREPENLVAWRSLGLAAKGVRPDLRRLAIARMRALSPIDPPIQ